MKKYFNYFIYISIAFLIYALYKADYLKIPEIEKFWILITSIIILIIGFVFDGITWQKTLVNSGYPIKAKDGIASTGLSVFGKYIPGKLWIIVGRSAYISRKYNFNEGETSYISFITQIISLWFGFALGLSGLFFIVISPIVSIIALAAWVILTCFLFVPIIHRFISSVLNRLTKGKINIPKINPSIVFKVLPYYIIRWLLFSISFLLFAEALTPDSVYWVTALGYPLAGTLGIIAVFTPGGLGVREGILTGYLIACGFTPVLAATIGVASRLWYLIGEVAIFSISMILKKTK
ncbi:MAG: lysylphosphatidylglycerol synthase transmembrane domain-containing protein [Salinivirgaceae bacterium]|jgi:uncharacterized membrane protein YbhN (UPF0104 family)|nr:lysylphosphatidylglycerol synthase transmembrane domain-containing protein [Salinivirgaceae bacterium]